MIGTFAIRSADSHDASELSRLMAEANLHTPIRKWLVADEDTRRDLSQRFFRTYLEIAMDHGPKPVIDVTDDLRGFAVWLRLGGDHRLERRPEHEDLLNSAWNRYAHRFRLFATVMRHCFARVSVEKCWVLAAMGVEPSHAGRGIGSALVRHRLAVADAETGWPIVAVALSTAHRTFLERHGFTVRPAFFLPDSGPPVWPMRRDR
jgi:GNAT superfamily N-acetyltransferase